MANGAVYFNASSGAGMEDQVQSLKRRIADEEIDFVEIGEDLDIRADIVSRQARGERLFIAAGGDGTVHHVVQPLVRTDSVFAVLPIGTFNHFASDIGMPLDWEKALDVIFGPHTRQVDVGKINDRYFMNNISLGLYPSVVKHREKLRKKHGKWMAYFLATQAAVRRMPHITLNLDADPHLEIVATHMFFVSANPYDLGELGVIAPRETLEGGKLAIYWIPHRGMWGFIKDAAKYLRGRVGTIDGLRSINTAHARIDASKKKLRVGVDGELWTMKLPIDIQIVPAGLQVRVPRETVEER